MESPRTRPMRFLLVFLFSLALAVPFSAQAFVITPESTGLYEAGNAAGIADTAPLLTMTGKLLRVLLGLLGVIVLGFTLYAGWLWVTANGDSKQTQKATQMLVQVFGGTLILLASGIIAGAVIRLLIQSTNGS